ncbi:protein CrcB [Frondihabitans australicus]|uniref:Fluoride-specific ion channel FluC n=1 Tax=Frondihabitans australicus TaxID=386892 RepID=A0A495IK03_9MICO|nr:protein CrcB [Frondihabitans australicus]
MNVTVFILTCAAGGGGALVRYAVGRWASKSPHVWPWPTAVINATGSFLLGVVTTFPFAAPGSAQWVMVLGTGALGGYTTFSTASVEALSLARQGRWFLAAATVWGVLVTCLIGASAGLAVGAHL